MAPSASISSTSDVSASHSGAEKVRLRVIHNGRMMQALDGKWKVIGGESYLESIPAASKYADLMYRLVEKLNVPVSVKYLCPGDDLDPDSLITVKDDDDVQEMYEEYFRGLRFPKTPARSYRLLVFCLPADEVGMTMEEEDDFEMFLSTSSMGKTMQDGTSGGVAVTMNIPHTSSFGSNIESGSNESSTKFETHDAVDDSQWPLYWSRDWPSKVARAAAKLSFTNIQVDAKATGSYDPEATNWATPDKAGAESVYKTQDPWFHTGDSMVMPHDGTPVHLPSHISAFGDGATPEVVRNMLAQRSRAQYLGGQLAGPQGQGSSDARPMVTPYPGSQAGAGSGGGDGDADDEVGSVKLPSHISAFGDGEDGSGADFMHGTTALVVSHALDDLAVDVGEARRAGARGGPNGVAHNFAPRPLMPGVVAGGSAGGQEDYTLEKVLSGESDGMLPTRNVHTISKDDVTILGRLGEGAFGEVSLANTPIFGKVAIKWLKPAKLEKHSDSFWGEAAILARLNHPNVIRFYGVVTDPVTAHVIGIMTEYVRGGSLTQVLRAARGHNLPVPLRVRAELALGAANGLAYLHEMRIVHFDLKPDNLLVDGDVAAADFVIKVADFGLSKQKYASYVSGVHDLRGTLPYMAPELVSDPDRVSEKADVWSFGMVMWEMLMLDVPFAKLTPQQIISGLMVGNLQPEVPEWCEAEWRGLMEVCWEVNPGSRPSFRDLANQLTAIINQIDGVPLPPPPTAARCSASELSLRWPPWAQQAAACVPVLVPLPGF